MQVDEVSSKQPLVGKMEDDDDKLSQLLSADRPEDIGEDSFFETGGLKVQAQSTRPQVFNSYLENQHAISLFREDDEILRQVHTNSVIDMPKNKSSIVPQTKNLHDGISKAKSTADEFEQQISMLQD